MGAKHTNYAYTCDPNDMLEVMLMDREFVFPLDVQSKGEYPVWFSRKRSEQNVVQGDIGNGTLKRYWKDSFCWYKKVIATNGEGLD